MKAFLSLFSLLYFVTTVGATAEPVFRALNTYADHEVGGVEATGPEVRYIEIPPLTLVSITVERTSGTCELRVNAGDGYRPEAADMLPVVSDVEAQIASVVEKANVTVLPPASEMRKVYLAFESVGKQPCSYRSYVRQADLPSAAGRAFAKMMVQMFVQSMISEITGMEPADLANNPVASRGIQAAMALLTTNSPAEFTQSMIMGEIRRRVTQEIPGNPAIASWVVNVFQDVAGNLYGPYFRAQIN